MNTTDNISITALRDEFEKVHNEHTAMIEAFKSVNHQHGDMLTALQRVEKEHDAMNHELAAIKTMLQTLLNR
jgi:hypothetical protein